LQPLRPGSLPFKERVLGSSPSPVTTKKVFHLEDFFKFRPLPILFLITLTFLILLFRQMQVTYTLKQLPKIAQQIIQKTKSKNILFYADMGTGKTTLIKELALQLGCAISSSPTFSLVNEYDTKTNEILYHFDFYRVKNEEEAYDIGFEEYLCQNAWVFIEWPENIENLLPLDAQVITINTNEDNTRTLTLQ